MSFTGDLKDISIIDVIQLLHTTKKSGTLYINGKRGESSVVFSEGNIIGADHLGKEDYLSDLLLEMGSVTPEMIEKITKNKESSAPLIASLIEQGGIDKKTLFDELKKLIEITVVELVGWRRGSFTLDTEALSPPEQYSFFSEKTNQQVCVDTQMVLMDALRIFDEQHRDRSPEEEAKELLEEEKWDEEVGKQDGFSNLTAEDLGLSDIDKLQLETPKQFSGVETFDISTINRQIVSETLSRFSDEEQEKFVSFLNEFSIASTENTDVATPEGKGLAVILFSCDKLLKYSVMTMFKPEPVFVFTSDTQGDLDQKIDQSISKDTFPILVFDSPAVFEDGLINNSVEQPQACFSEEKIAGLCLRAVERYPNISIIQLFRQRDFSHFESFGAGVMAMFPLPARESHCFIDENIDFLNSFYSYIKNFFNKKEKPRPKSFSQNVGQISNLRSFIVTLRNSKDNKDVSSALLKFVSEIFERTVIFFVRETCLTGDKNRGIRVGNDTVDPAKLSFPLSKPSIICEVLEKGKVFFGEIDDKVVKEHIFNKITPPLRPKVLLLPIVANGKTVAIIYGDFAQKEPVSVQLDTMEILSNQAGIILENLLYRNHFRKTVTS